MTRRHLYSIEYQRPSRRYGPQPPVRLSFRWDASLGAYVHSPSGCLLRSIIDAADAQGRSFAVDYSAAERCTFSVRS